MPVEMGRLKVRAVEQCAQIACEPKEDEMHNVEWTGRRIQDCFDARKWRDTLDAGFSGDATIECAGVSVRFVLFLCTIRESVGIDSRMA